MFVIKLGKFDIKLWNSWSSCRNSLSISVNKLSNCGDLLIEKTGYPTVKVCYKIEIIYCHIVEICGQMLVISHQIGVFETICENILSN